MSVAARFAAPALSLSLLLSFPQAKVLAQAPAAPPAPADESLFQAAQADYAARNYEKALSEMEAYIKGGISKPEPIYYLGLIYQQLGRLSQAQKAYELLIQHFPGTPAAELGKKALAQVKAALAPGPAVVPKETWVPFERIHNAMFIDARVNGHPQRMIFDTGAERCAFSLNNLKQMGVALPKGPPTGSAAGVGKAEAVPIWTVKIDLTVGRIERRNFPVMVGDMPLPAPLLGQDFLNGLEYSIDSSNNAISFKKKSGEGAVTLASVATAGMTVDAQGNYVYTVPFTLQGDCAVVNVNVNGKLMPMIFDTGASICLFTAAQAQKAGVSYSSGPSVLVGGVGGTTAARVGIVDSIKLGPIEKSQARIPVTDKIAAPMSLLGQDFVKGWHYTIDKEAKVIRFTRGY